MKKSISLLLALCLCLGVAVPALCAPALAAEVPTTGSCGDYVIWTYDADKRTITISGTGPMDIYWQNPLWDDYTGKGSHIQASIQTVVVEEGVTFISDLAFRGCTNLTKVTLPRSVTNIGANAFAETPWQKTLGEFAIVNGILIKYQGQKKNVVIPGGVTNIACGAFYQNETVTSVTIPEGVTAIGVRGLNGGPFQGCASLTDITFPSTLKYVGMDCFEGTPWLAGQKGDFIMAGSVLLKYRGKNPDVVIPDGVTAAADLSLTVTGDDDVLITSLTVPVSMVNLNSTMSLFIATADCLPQTVTYKGNRTQWNNIEGTEWLTENKIPVHCTGPVDPMSAFTDMEPGAFYLKGVAWAVQHEVTTGKTARTFAPKDRCTHAQILIFLWRAEGMPESAIVTPFPMTGREDYYGAAKWAFERGMINASFDPKAPCSRADAVRYIWQAMGKPYAVYDGRFSDVPANSPYAQAVAWAVNAKVTDGTGNGRFSPGKICNRGQIVTFLERTYNR